MGHFSIGLRFCFNRLDSTDTNLQRINSYYCKLKGAIDIYVTDFNLFQILI